MNLPQFPPLNPIALTAIAQKVGAHSARQLPSTGIFNSIYSLDERYILRVPRQASDFIEALRREVVAIPLVRQAGVRTPKVVLYDDSLEIIETPYLIVEQLQGQNLAGLGLAPEQTPQVWRELGRDLAVLHQTDSTDQAIRDFADYPMPDPRELNQNLALKGYYTALEAAWIEGWLEKLAPYALAPNLHCFRHGDIQTTNLMVEPSAPTYLALIDWGAACWGDPAFDFAGIPLQAVPMMLEGYREVAPIVDESLEARILWRHLQLSLYLLSRPPLPNLSWAERPLGMMLQTLRFLLDSKDSTWRQLVL